MLPEGGKLRSSVLNELCHARADRVVYEPIAATIKDESNDTQIASKLKSIVDTVAAYSKRYP